MPFIKETGKPATFPAEILTRHFTPEWLTDRFKDLPETFTDEEMRKAFPGPEDKDFQDRILGILSDLREMDLLKPIPHGADRNIHEAKGWNSFVASGRDGLLKYAPWALFRTPLPQVIWSGLFGGIQDYEADRRRDEGVDRKLSLEMTRADIQPAVAASLDRMVKLATGTHSEFWLRPDLKCPKTDINLSWAEGQFLAPVIGVTDYKSRSPDGPLFTPLEAFTRPKPVRHVEINLTSGILMMADWFRVDGFSEGVGDTDYSKPSINSDLGIDLRTQDYIERLGLASVHVGNRVPGIFKDGEILRVGSLDKDQYFSEDKAGSSGRDAPDEIGTVCCDLWDVTFSDREVLIDILFTSGEYPERLAAAEAFDAHVEEEDYVNRLDIGPGPLHIYMPTGHSASNFHKAFEPFDLPGRTYMRDLFVLSRVPLDVDPEIVEEANWAWPERYAAKPESDVEEEPAP